MRIVGCMAFGLSFLLMGCNDSEPTTAYFLQHPKILEKKLQTCLTNKSDASAQMIATCKAAVEAEKSLRVYLQEEQMDPEGFGQRILDAEYASADLLLKINMAEKDLLALQGTTMNAAKIKELNEKLVALKKMHESKQEEVRVLLAVAGLNSPE